MRFWKTNMIKKNHLFSNSELLSIYNIKNVKFEDVLIISFFNNNIDLEIVTYQKKVFEFFNLPLLQINDNCSHAEFLFSTFKNFNSFKYFIFFDIDCIPLQKEAIFSLLNDIQDGNTISGAIQTANHKKEGKNVYVGPFFLGISKSLFEKLCIESLDEDDNNDIGGILTSKSLDIGANIKYWFPTEVEMPCWNLYPENIFGYGTTYNGMIYHAFQIRFNTKNRFIKKCNSILK